MHYDYSGYLRDSIILVLQFSFTLFAIISTVVFYCRLFLDKKSGKTDLFKSLTVVLISGILLSISICKLIHGGAAVFFEKEADRVQLQGEVSHIEQLGYWGVPKLEIDGGSGTLLTVNGVTCRAVVDVPLNVGDYVRITYLPRSGYILSLEEIDSP